MSHGALFQVFLYLLAAVVAVPLAKRLGFGSVLGYLLAGAALGPQGLGWIGERAEDIRHFAEFGVVMMLFLIGLELRPSVLWRMRAPIFGLGGLQVALTAGAVLLVGLALGWPWRMALALGFILAMSSTALALQSLKEKGWDKGAGGQASFSVLLFQDLAVIPILALFAWLAAGDGGAAQAAHGAAETAMGGLQALFMLGAVAAVVFGGRFLSRPLFRFIASAGLREIFTAAAILLVVGITLLMEKAGLSPALGAFLGGVVLADSEYRHEIESDIEPFKGLLLGLFFLSVGAGVDFHLLGAKAGEVALWVPGLLLLKGGILLGLARVFKLSWRDGGMAAVSLSQVGEFAFVLLGVAGVSGLLASETGKLFEGVTALTMAMTPLLLAVYEKAVLPRFAAKTDQRDADAVSGHAPVIIAGFGRVGNMVGRLLRANGVETHVLDVDPDLIDMVRRIGLQAYYGDASRLDLLEAAGAAEAKVLILALDNPEKTLEICETARKHFPHLRILARARGREDAYRLINLGLQSVHRETFGTALEMGEEALRALGFRAHHSHRMTRLFRRKNEADFREMAAHYGKKSFFSAMREKIAATEEQMRRFSPGSLDTDHAFENAVLREERKGNASDPG